MARVAKPGITVTDQRSWRVVQSLLMSIQQETLSLSSPESNVKLMPDLDLWTQSLIGVIQLGAEDPTAVYTDYLEEKYR